MPTFANLISKAVPHLNFNLPFSYYEVVECLFICLKATCIAFFVNCVFLTFAHLMYYFTLMFNNKNIIFPLSFAQQSPQRQETLSEPVCSQGRAWVWPP